MGLMQMLRQHFQSVLKRVGVYQRLKASCVYDLYWNMTDKQRIDHRSREVDFYRKLLDGYHIGDLIFDVGANAGDKTDVFLRLGARVVAVEPDEGSQKVLRERFLRYRLVPKPVVVVGKAVSERNRVETMWIDGPGSALNTLNQKWVAALRNDKSRFEHTQDKLDFATKREVETITLNHLIETYGFPFFVKIDVEGNELATLKGLGHPVPYLSFEVNLPEFRSEGLACIEVLRGLSKDGVFNYTVSCRQGLALARWLPHQEFSRVLDQCASSSIEVFWKASVPIQG